MLSGSRPAAQQPTWTDDDDLLTPHASPIAPNRTQPPTQTTQTTQPRKRLRDEVAPGDHLYEQNFYTVKSVNRDANTGTTSVLVTNLKGVDSILPVDLLEGLTSTSHYTKEYLKNPTELSRMPETFNEQSFRVTYSKQVEANDVADALLDRLGEAGQSKAKCRKVMRELMKGERRVMHAKLRLTMHGEPIMERGRYSVIDLDVAHKRAGDPGIRWVDSRTITELVINGMRFYSNEYKEA
tara:strand:- start:1440 stop:2156 length:717 start_codon:yes stop_codon:yes gene_type:complete